MNSKYSDYRELMRPGDVVAFEGSGPFPELVRWATRSYVSHVGVVLKTSYEVDYTLNQLIETAWCEGNPQVVITRLSDKIEMEQGTVWWLPLNGTTRAKMDFKTFYDFLVLQKGKPYDITQAVKSAVDVFDKFPILEVLTNNKEDFGKLFCSELVAVGLERSGAIRSLNCSEVTPIDLCRFRLYNDCVRIKGDREIRGFNSVDPEGFGE